VVFDDFGIDQVSAMGLEAFMRAFLVGSHQPRVSRDISG